MIGPAVFRRVIAPCLAVVVAAVACCVGCGPGGDRSAGDATAALAAVVGDLPDGLEVLAHESRGGQAAAWVVRTRERWLPQALTDHRHQALRVDAFANLVAGITHGSLDIGRPVDRSCEYAEWRQTPAGGGGRVGVRIHQLRTDRGDFTVLETLSDPGSK